MGFVEDVNKIIKLVEDEVFKPASQKELTQRVTKNFRKLNISDFKTKAELLKAMDSEAATRLEDMNKNDIQYSTWYSYFPQEMAQRMGMHERDSFDPDADYYEEFHAVEIVSRISTDELLAVWDLGMYEDEEEVMEMLRKVNPSDTINKDLKARGLIKEDVFQPASQEELNVRREELKKREEEERIRLQKEREAAIKAAGPAMREAYAMIPLVREAEERYRAASEEYQGNYGGVRDNGFINTASYNIKMYDTPDLPKGVREKLDKYGLWESYDYWYNDDVGRQLESFVEGLMEDYPFIEKWGVEGRSGGWLVLDIGTMGPPYTDDMEYTLADLEDQDKWSQWNSRYLTSVARDMRRYIFNIDKRIKALGQIENKIEKGKKAVIKMFEEPEWWDNFFENHKDDMEEQDEEEAEEAKA